jgi:hypothetical protein
MLTYTLEKNGSEPSFVTEFKEKHEEWYSWFDGHLYTIVTGKDTQYGIQSYQRMVQDWSAKKRKR